MQETPPETQTILRRNIKYNRLIQSVILICSMILIGISDTKTEEIPEKKAEKEVKVDVTEIETIELSAGVSKKIVHLSKEPLSEPQVEKLEVETVSSVADTYKSLEEVKISRYMNLTETTGLSREDFCELLANFKYDYAGFYENNAGLIWDLSQKYQVNEIFICGVFALESYYGSNESHIKAHNYGSIMTKDGKLVQYATDAEGIEANFKLFADCYLNPEGKYYKGVTLNSVGDTYCPPKYMLDENGKIMLNKSGQPIKLGPSWAYLVYNCMQKFLKE